MIVDDYNKNVDEKLEKLIKQSELKQKNIAMFSSEVEERILNHVK